MNSLLNHLLTISSEKTLRTQRRGHQELYGGSPLRQKMLIGPAEKRRSWSGQVVTLSVQRQSGPIMEIIEEQKGHWSVLTVRDL